MISMTKPAYLLAIILPLLGAAVLLYAAGSLRDIEPARQNGAVLILCQEEQAPASFRFLQTGLALAGFSSRTWTWPANAFSRSSLLAAEISQFAQTTGYTPNQIWLAASGGDTAEIWALASQVPEIAGMLLLSPGRLDQVDAAMTSNWPAGRPVAIFTGKSPAAAPDTSGQLLFEYLTGEDARLLPAFRLAGPGQPWRYTSVNGRVHLSIYPLLPANLVLLSPRVIPDAARWLDEWSPGTTSSRLLAHNGQTLINHIFLLILAGLLLLAVPAGIGFALTHGGPDRKQNDAAYTLPSDESWLQAVLWIPAAALAGGFGLLSCVWTGSPDEWLAHSLLILPGCRGWLFALTRLLRRRYWPGSSETTSKGLGARCQVPYILAGTALFALTGLIAAWWINQSFGALMPPGWSWLILPLLILINYPAALAGSSRLSGQAARERGLRQRSGLAFLWQHLPFLVLPVWAYVAAGINGLLAGLMLLVLALWSASLGRAASRLSHHESIGNLAQAFFYSAGILMPPILSGLRLV
jgi:hypothetical protein